MKNICKTIVGSILILILFCEKTYAQDPHFSQFYNAPIQLNPALTGMMKGDLRGVINYRSQWSSIATPFQTMGASIDMKMLGHLTKKDILGIGLTVANDLAGEADLKNIQLGVSIAYHKDMTGKRNNFIGIGAQYLIAQQSVDFTKLRFESQFNGEFIDPDLSSGENFAVNDFTYYDFIAGISWNYQPTRHRSFYLGGSIAHLNAPKVSFFNDIQERLNMKYTFYGGADFKINKNISFIPRGVVLLQGVAQEINVGALMSFNVGTHKGADDQTTIYFGTMHRWRDAQVIIMRYDYNNVGISFSYDVNISKLNIPSKGRGAVELAIIYRGNVFDDKRFDKIECPKF